MHEGEGRKVLLALLTAVTAMVVGVLWDISWDASVGADSFWSPPHVATNFGAAAAGIIALAGLAGARDSGDSRRSAVGWSLIVWGAVAMLGFLVLENWWSQAYGLFAERWSPPELLFTAASAAILVGSGAVLAGAGVSSIALCWVVALSTAFAVAASTPLGLPNLHRTATFGLVACSVYPALLAWGARAGGTWGATLSAALYAGLLCVLIWILPLFEARPVIGPIYQQVDRFLPPSFPLLLVVPALAFDVVLSRMTNDWLRALACGAAFVVTFLPVQWLFAAFLLSPASDNWLFAGGGRHWPFYVQIGPEGAMFWGIEQDPLLFSTIVAGLAAAVVSARAGLWLGAAVAGVRS